MKDKKLVIPSWMKTPPADYVGNFMLPEFELVN